MNIRLFRIVPPLRYIAPFVSIRALASEGYDHIKVEKRGRNNSVQLVQLNRPEALNALCGSLLDELEESLERAESDGSIASIVLTGSERAFAAGVDIGEMQDWELQSCFKRGLLANSSAVSRVRKPVIAAVNGLALGGGCELAMMCDVIYAGRNAIFGQPEITLGTIPGMGGSQRLPRIVGKSLAMEMCLSGGHISAEKALSFGLVSKVCEPENVVSEAIKLGERIGNKSRLVASLCKEAVSSAYELSLGQGLECERRLVCSTFGMEDRREGMAAFFEKRKPRFKDN